MKVKHKIGGYYKLRSSGGVVAFLEGAGEAVASRANGQLKNGQGFKMSSRQGEKRPQGRWRVTVAAVTPYAKRANAKHNTLIRALGGGVSVAEATLAQETKVTKTRRPAAKGGGRRRWTAEEIRGIASGSVAEAAARTGRSEAAVRAYRRRIRRG